MSENSLLEEQLEAYSHTAMACREHEPVAIEPQGVTRIVLHGFCPQHIAEACTGGLQHVQIKTILEVRRNMRKRLLLASQMQGLHGTGGKQARLCSMFSHLGKGGKHIFTRG